MTSTLLSRNITVDGHRTSIRLEPEMWEALDEICRREALSIHDFCSLVDQQRCASSLTAAVRVALLTYFREASKGRALDLMPRTPALAVAASA
ncbi:MAG: ribbon-helix-helix domain-containing protein [Rhodospirillaceae bacterium]|nr:ribbon-helix-helix domain-containing protein [Rhodospirillaceae bacterium]